MQNFLKETLENLEEEGKSVEDITFIGSEDYEYECSWEEFLKLADFLYDSGYGSAYIPEDLVIRFKDGSYFERGEYDGSEWWRLVSFRPRPTTESKKIERLNTDLFFLMNTVKNLQEEG